MDAETQRIVNDVIRSSNAKDFIMADHMGIDRDAYLSRAWTKGDVEKLAAELFVEHGTEPPAVPVYREVERPEFSAVVNHPTMRLEIHPLVRRDEPLRARERVKPAGWSGIATYYVGRHSGAIMAVALDPLNSALPWRYFLTHWGHAEEEAFGAAQTRRAHMRTAVDELRAVARSGLTIAEHRRSIAAQNSRRDNARYAARGGLSR